MDNPALLFLASLAAVLLPLIGAWWLLGRYIAPRRRPPPQHARHNRVLPPPADDDHR